MIKRFGVHGLIEYRRYSFGGAFLVVGKKWITLKRGSMPQGGHGTIPWGA